MRLATEAKCSECLPYKIVVSKSEYLRKLSGGQIQSITNPLDRSTQQAYNGIASNNNAIVPPAGISCQQQSWCGTTDLEPDARTLVTSATPTDEKLLQYPSPLGWDHIRSEERRVGKEC